MIKLLILLIFLFSWFTLIILIIKSSVIKLKIKNKLKSLSKKNETFFYSLSDSFDYNYFRKSLLNFIELFISFGNKKKSYGFVSNILKIDCLTSFKNEDIDSLIINMINLYSLIVKVFYLLIVTILVLFIVW